jgi:hypothetical protein
LALTASRCAELGWEGVFSLPFFDFQISDFCTGMHSFPQLNFEIPLAKKNRQAYSLAQVEPGRLKNLTAQLKEGAAVARPPRPQSFYVHPLAASFPWSGRGRSR